MLELSVDGTKPTIMHFMNATVELLVTRTSMARVDDAITPEMWAVPGVYALLGLPSQLPSEQHSSTSVVRVRPGRSGDVLKRLRRHAADPEFRWATRAVLVRDTRQGFNTAQTGYLEGRLHEFCDTAPGIEHVGRMDRDFTLQVWERDELERLYVPYIRAVLELTGVPVVADESARAEEDRGAPA